MIGECEQVQILQFFRLKFRSTKKEKATKLRPHNYTAYFASIYIFRHEQPKISENSAEKTSLLSNFQYLWTGFVSRRFWKNEEGQLQINYPQASLSAIQRGRQTFQGERNRANGNISICIGANFEAIQNSFKRRRIVRKSIRT